MLSGVFLFLKLAKGLRKIPSRLFVVSAKTLLVTGSDKVILPDLSSFPFVWSNPKSLAALLNDFASVEYSKMSPSLSDDTGFEGVLGSSGVEGDEGFEFED